MITEAYPSAFAARNFHGTLSNVSGTSSSASKHIKRQRLSAIPNWRIVVFVTTMLETIRLIYYGTTRHKAEHREIGPTKLGARSWNRTNDGCFADS